MIFTKDILDFLFAQYVIYVLHSACLDGLYSVITCAPLIGCDARGDDHVMTLSCSDFYTFFPFFLSPLTSSEELQVPQGRVACIFSELLVL